MREVCQACGGWIDCGTEFTTWPTRKSAFLAAHKRHESPARWPGDDTARDAFTRVLLVMGLTPMGYTPVGGGMLVANVSRPGQPGQPADLLKVLVRTPNDLVA